MTRRLCIALKCLIVATILCFSGVAPTYANYFDCSVIIDEFDQLMTSNFLIEPDRYVTIIEQSVTRDQFLQIPNDEFKLRAERENSGIGVVKTNQNTRGKMLFSWQDSSWETKTPFVINELITYGRAQDGHAPIRSNSIYLSHGFAVDLDTAAVVEPDNKTADLIYVFENGEYSIRAIEPAQLLVLVESMCYKIRVSDGNATQ